MNVRRSAWNRPIAERLDACHTKDPMSGCWIWEGTLRNGYGVMRLRQGRKYAHRLAYQTHVGQIPDGMEVCHRCDVKCCINPAHLFIGTHHDNMMDAWRKQIVKQPPVSRGVAHHAAKLDNDCVRSVRARYAGGETQRALARELGMTQAAIQAIVSNKTWRHI